MTGGTPDVERRYVEVAGRLVHYRVCGDGPPIVLLHDSPRSSRLHLATMADLADTFRVFALDTPGYGNSDPLGLPAPTVRDFADALGATLATLGLAGAPLYATHTSAKIALAHAVRTGAPPLLVLDGLSIPDRLPPEDFIAAYMRPFRPDAGGAYLAAEWSRMRDMLRWFPWFETAPARRIPMDSPSEEWMADYGIDLFSAGPHYADAYTAAMRWSPIDDLIAVRIPTHVIARRDDVLYGFLDKVPLDRNSALSIERLPADRTQWLGRLRAVLRNAAGTRAAPTPSRADAATSTAYLSLPHGQLRFHRRGEANGGKRLLVLSAPTTLHALAVADTLAASRATLIPELPGFGESDPLPDPAIDAFADVLAAMIAEVGGDRVDVLCIDLAAPIAARLAARHPGKVSALVIDGAPPTDLADAVRMADGLCPDMTFDAQAGSHLHRIWHMLRDGEVQWPWHDRSQASIRSLPPLLSADRLHAALTGVLLQPLRYGDAARAALSACTLADWRMADVPALVLTHPTEPAHAGTQSILSVLPQGENAPRPDDGKGLARMLNRLLDAEMAA